MSKRFKWLATLAVAAALAVAALAITAGSGTADDPGLQDAIAKAEALIGAEHSEAEFEDGVYEVEFMIDGQEVEVTVDQDGNVVEQTTGDDEDTGQDD